MHKHVLFASYVIFIYIKQDKHYITMNLTTVQSKEDKGRQYVQDFFITTYPNTNFIFETSEETFDATDIDISGITKDGKVHTVTSEVKVRYDYPYSAFNSSILEVTKFRRIWNKYKAHQTNTNIQYLMIWKQDNLMEVFDLLQIKELIKQNKIKQTKKLMRANNETNNLVYKDVYLLPHSTAKRTIKL